jgi:hypothetical protein
MGIFHDMVTVINRAPITLQVTFDGQTTRIPPGETALPKIVVPFAKNQHPICGSASMDNPHITGARYLISVKGSADPQEPLTEEEWDDHCAQVSRFDMADYYADRLAPKEHAIVRGKGPVQAKSSFDAGVHIGSPEQFEHNE